MNKLLLLKKSGKITIPVENELASIYGDALGYVGDLIEKYEDEHYPIAPSVPKT